MNYTLAIRNNFYVSYLFIHRITHRVFAAKVMTLYQLREARSLTQVNLAKVLNINQGAVSKMEKRTDMYVSTLRNFIQAMGGQLQVKAIFPEGEIQIARSCSPRSNDPARSPRSGRCVDNCRRNAPDAYPAFPALRGWCRGRGRSAGVSLRLDGLLQPHGDSDGGADHGIVAHARGSPSFHVGRDRTGPGELGIRVHAAHGVGHAVGGGTGGHVVGMQGAAGSAAAGHREVLLALFVALLLVGAGHRVLEAGGVGGVAGDRHVHAFVVVDGHALAHVVGAVAAHLGLFALGIGDLPHDVAACR